MPCLATIGGRRRNHFSNVSEARLEIVQQQLHVRLYIFLLRSAFHRSLVDFEPVPVMPRAHRPVTRHPTGGRQ